jgi:hypothetical protein
MGVIVAASEEDGTAKPRRAQRDAKFFRSGRLLAIGGFSK